MDKVKVQYSDLQNGASKFQQCGSEAEALISKLQGIVQNVKSNWVGESYTAFEGEFNDIRPKLQQFIELCNKMSQQITASSNSFQEADNQARSLFSGL